MKTYFHPSQSANKPPMAPPDAAPNPKNISQSLVISSISQWNYIRHGNSPQRSQT